jgi:hypothetical protein
MKKMQFLAQKMMYVLEGSHLNNTSLCNSLKTMRFKEKMQRIRAFKLHENSKNIKYVPQEISKSAAVLENGGQVLKNKIHFFDYGKKIKECSPFKVYSNSYRFRFLNGGLLELITLYIYRVIL